MPRQPLQRSPQATKPHLLKKTENQRLALAVVVSVLLHALLLSLVFSGQGLGLPGFGMPWQERRGQTPDVRVVLAPLRASTDAPAGSGSVALAQSVLPPASTRQTAAVTPALPPEIPQANTPATVPNPATPAYSEGRDDAAPASTVPPTKVAAAQIESATPALPETPQLPAPVPESAVITTESEVAPQRPLTAAPSASSPQATARATSEAADAAREKAAAAAHERALEQARLDELEREAQSRAQKQAQQQEAARKEAARLEAERQAAARLEAAKQEAEQAERLRLEAERAAAALQASQQKEAQEKAAQDEAARQAAQKAEAMRLEAARQATAQIEAAKQEAERAERTRLEAEKQEAARKEAARLEAARQEAQRIEAARREAERLEGERKEALRQEALRQENIRQEAARQASARQEAARAEAAQDDARREASRRAMGRQLDEEAARRDAAAAAAAAQPSTRSPSFSGLRRARLLGRSDPNPDIVLYAEAWARKIQLNPTLEKVREAARRPHTHPLVTVAIRSDGSVESVTFVQTSGVPEIDQAVLQIVQGLVPYAPFPPALAREFDVIEIRRSWQFDTAVRLY